MLAQVAAVLIVIVFWVILFIGVFWFVGRTLRAPIPVEDEETHAQTEQPDHNATSQEDNGAPVDQSHPVNSKR